MSITGKEVEQVGRLARLALREDEIAGLTRDLNSILAHMRELEAADVEGTREMDGVSEHSAPFRDDVPGADALHIPPSRLAPEWAEGFFVVPRLAALDADALEAEGGA